MAVGEQYAVAERNPIYFVVPMTVECWVKVGQLQGSGRGVASATIFLANEPRHSQTHWALYAQPNTGFLAAAMPGWDVKELSSTTNVLDGKWHHVGFVFDGKTLILFADGAKVAQTAVKKIAPYPDTGPLVFGHLPGLETNHNLLLDEVRISRVARPISPDPTKPFTPDADTVALWHFDDERSDTFADASQTRNPAHLHASRNPPRPPAASTPASSSTAAPAGPTWTSAPSSAPTLTIPSQKQNITHKAVSIHLDTTHSIAFDTELLRISAAWTGDFLAIKPVREGLGGPPDVAGTVAFSTPPVPGWSDADDFADPRPDRLGPLPRNRARFTGLYPHGNDVVLAYRVYGTDVLELNGVETPVATIPGSNAATPPKTLEIEWRNPFNRRPGSR